MATALAFSVHSGPPASLIVSSMQRILFVFGRVHANGRHILARPIARLYCFSRMFLKVFASFLRVTGLTSSAFIPILFASDSAIS